MSQPDPHDDALLDLIAAVQAAREDRKQALRRAAELEQLNEAQAETIRSPQTEVARLSERPDSAAGTGPA